MYQHRHSIPSSVKIYNIAAIFSGHVVSVEISTLNIVVAASTRSQAIINDTQFCIVRMQISSSSTLSPDSLSPSWEDLNFSNSTKFQQNITLANKVQKLQYVQRELFHSTLEISTDTIILDGIMRAYAQKNGSGVEPSFVAKVAGFNPIPSTQRCGDV